MRAIRVNLDSRKILRERQAGVYISFSKEFGNHTSKCIPFSCVAPAVAGAKAHQFAVE